MNELRALFIYFAGYSLLGWICETIYCSVLSRKFINRGFLNGPFCPVYGFGALILLQILWIVPHDIVIVFLAGTLITTALEYFTGFLLETLFHAKWWDYSQHRFNFRGRICLLNSVLFGLMSVGLIFIIHPAVSGFIAGIPQIASNLAASVLLLYFTADLVITVKSMRSLNLRLENLNKALAAAKERLDVSEFYNALNISQRLEKLHELLETDKGKAIYNSIESVRERIKQLENDNRVFQNRIIKAFPNIRSTRYPEMLLMVKEKIMHSTKDAGSINAGSMNADKNNDDTNLTD